VEERTDEIWVVVLSFADSNPDENNDDVWQVALFKQLNHLHNHTTAAAHWAQAMSITRYHHCSTAFSSNTA